MRLTSIYLKTLRGVWIAILGWGLGFGLLICLVLSQAHSLMDTPQARASLIQVSQSFAAFGAPLAVDTPGGYVTYKYGLVLVVIAIWPLLACSRLLRGEEEHGSLDLLLSLPRGRVRLALEKLAAIWSALLGIGLLIALLTFAGGQGAHAPFTFGDAILFGLNIVLICGVFGSLAFFLSQFTRERGTAAGITGVLLLVAVLMDMTHRVDSSLLWLSRLSPVYYYNLSLPLVPGHHADAGGLLVLLAISVVLTGVGLYLFLRRDIGGVIGFAGRSRSGQASQAARPAYNLPARAWSLRSLYMRSLGTLVRPTLWWTLAIALYAGWMVFLTRQTLSVMASLYQSSSLLSTLISKVGGGDIATNATMLSALFLIVPLLLMAFAVTQVDKWESDEEEGRVDLVLVTPHSRLAIVLARFAALTTALIFTSVVTLLATLWASYASGLKLDFGNVVAATLSIIPLGMLIAALGYLLGGWLRAAFDTGLLSFLLVIWFFISFVGPEFHLSDAELHLSAFYYYGTPLLHGLPVGDTIGVLVVALVLLALATLRFISKDIEH